MQYGVSRSFFFCLSTAAGKQEHPTFRKVPWSHVVVEQFLFLLL